MATMQSIKERFGGYICRHCINEVYGMQLRPADCLYDLYPRECARCGKMHNIVRKVRLGKRILLSIK